MFNIHTHICNFLILFVFFVHVFYAAYGIINISNVRVALLNHLISQTRISTADNQNLRRLFFMYVVNNNIL